MTVRGTIVAANWKMNGSTKLVETQAALLTNASWSPSTTVILAPPAPYLAQLAKACSANKSISIAAQNIHHEACGAFTAEISHAMLTDLGIHWTILGHSERRELFFESDIVCAEKTRAALKAGISVIFCCGEKLSEREAGQTKQVVYRQLEALGNVIQDWSNVVIAYEPVWAIGTGKVASPQQAQEVHSDIRAWLTQQVDQKVAESTRILYGGSVNAGNCKTLGDQPDIDGFLVGGASLKAEFLDICQFRG